MGREHYASDYFPFLYDYAEYLIGQGKAYVCDLSDEEIKEYREISITRARRAPTGIARWKKTSISSGA